MLVTEAFGLRQGVGYCLPQGSDRVDFVLQCGETVVVWERCRLGERQEAVVVVRLYFSPTQ